MTRMSCGSLFPCVRDSRAMLIMSTDIIKKEHPTPSYSQLVHLLQFLLGTRLHGVSFLCPDRLACSFIFSLVILSDELITFEAI